MPRRPTTLPAILPALSLAALLGLGSGLAASPARAFDITAMTPQESQAFGAAVRGYLLENPQVLMEVIGALEKSQAEAQTLSDADMVRDNAKALFEDPSSWVGGNPEGDITVVEFLDYRCGYCRKAHEEVRALLKSDGNIRYIVKEYPILGPESVVGARFALATLQVAGPEAYETLNHALYTDFRGAMTIDRLSGLATKLGLDARAISGAMQSPEVSAALAANQALGQRMVIEGTPTFIIGGQMVRGYMPLSGMKSVVADERG